MTRWRAMGVVAALAGIYIAFAYLLPLLHESQTRSHHWESPAAVIVLGLIQGTTYGLLAVGLVLIYRTNRIVNFAHGEIGAFGAAFFGLAVINWHLPYWVAFLPALLLAGGVSALAEVAVIRRLRKAPALMSVVATLGVGQFLVLFALVLVNKQAGFGRSFPEPSGMPSFHVGQLILTPAYTAMLVMSPLVVIAVAVFLKYSRFGLALRFAAGNPDVARMSGIFASRMSTLAWALAGALSAFSAILAAPGQGYATGDSFGPSLLLRALAGAVIGRMKSMPMALLGGLGLGVVEQLLYWNFGRAGAVELALFVIILVSLLVQRRRGGRSEEKGSWAAVQGLRPLPAALREVWLVRNLGLLVGVVTVTLVALLPLVISNYTSVKVVGDFALVIVALSVGIITGLAGQLSLGQFALAAVGAVTSYQVARRTGNYVESFVYAGAIAAAASVLIGIPALRIRGLMLTVTTLSFALVVPAWLLQQPWAFGVGVDPGQPILFHHALTSGHSYFYVALGTLLVALVLARNVRRGGVGRLLIAVRDNEDAARAFTVPASRVKLQGFALAGFIAGIGGAMYAHSLSLVGTTAFPTSFSIDVVKIAVIGGVSILSGPLIGALLVLGVEYLPLDNAGFTASALGQLLIIMYLPGGLGSLVGPVRDVVASKIAARAGVDVVSAYLAEASVPASLTGGAPLTATTDRSAPPPSLASQATRQRRQPLRGQLLEVRGLEKSFGGVRAVRGISFDVAAGETLGLIGPNGAGKTTTFELIAGFTRADAGTVRFAGRDITGGSPEARGRTGLIRSFQDAALFSTLTVHECVQVALERVDRTQFLPAMAGLTGQERRKNAAAREIVSWMGLDRYRSTQIQQLSTGTRRITEIACLIALQPQMLLLDEPSSGVAQRETEALGVLLAQLKQTFDLTMVIIEHDIPMIMSLADRIVVMADGETIAAGTPDIVRTDPRVVEAYLGGSLTAIDRSGLGEPLLDIGPLETPGAKRRQPTATSSGRPR